MIQSLREELQYKGAAASTFVTYDKQWRRIAEAFSLLPASQGPLLDWLRQFKDPKNRGLWHQALSQLYKHGAKHFGFSSNPLDGVPRPQPLEKPVVALTLDEARALDAAPEDDQERLVVDLLLGHGWRGIELRRLTPRMPQAHETARFGFGAKSARNGDRSWPRHTAFYCGYLRGYQTRTQCYAQGAPEAVSTNLWGKMASVIGLRTSANARAYKFTSHTTCAEPSVAWWPGTRGTRSS